MDVTSQCSGPDGLPLPDPFRSLWQNLAARFPGGAGAEEVIPFSRDWRAALLRLWGELGPPPRWRRDLRMVEDTLVRRGLLAEGERTTKPRRRRAA